MAPEVCDNCQYWDAMSLLYHFTRFQKSTIDDMIEAQIAATDAAAATYAGVSPSDLQGTSTRTPEEIAATVSAILNRPEIMAAKQSLLPATEKVITFAKQYWGQLPSIAAKYYQ